MAVIEPTGVAAAEAGTSPAPRGRVPAGNRVVIA